INFLRLGKNLKKYVKYAKIQIKAVVVDFIGDLDKGMKKIKKTTEGLDVGISLAIVVVGATAVIFIVE
ncbi:hypothetical protein Goshw_003776, partial [Gossypium schwendimanii]|nr:hypothetical protein [Gossypium schwendimanii]